MEEPSSSVQDDSNVEFASVYVKVEVKCEPEDVCYEEENTDYYEEGDNLAGCDNFAEGEKLNTVREDGELRPKVHFEENDGDEKKLNIVSEDGEFHPEVPVLPLNFMDVMKQDCRQIIKPRKRRKKKGKPQIFKCPCCPYKASKNRIKVHMAKHVDSKPFTCDLCPFRSNYKLALSRHFRHQHQGVPVMVPKPDPKKYRCNICKYTTAYRHALKGHMMTHSDEKPHQCDLCDYKTKHSTALRKHKQVLHEGIKPPPSNPKKNLQCNFCDYKTHRKQALQIHLATHSHEKPHQCEYCDFETKHHSALHRHRLTLHKDELNKLDPQEKPREYKCQKCDFTTFYKKDLTAHAKTHEVTSYPCDICKEFVTESYELFSAHVQEHCVRNNADGESAGLNLESIKKISDAILTVIKGMKLEGKMSAKKKKRTNNLKFICDHCAYTTKYKNALEHHMRKHDNKKPFKCEHCHYVTKYPNSMHRHKILQHIKEANIDLAQHNIREHKCQLCDYKTYYKNNLKAHMRKHSTDKQYKCDLCDYESAYKNCYEKHMKAHERSEMATSYQCDKCPFSTQYEGRMSWHLLKIHKQEMDNAHKCPYCDFSTKVKWRLTIHLQRSQLSAAEGCSYCEFEGSYKCELKRHRTIHFPPLDADVYNTIPTTDAISFLAPNNPEIVENCEATDVAKQSMDIDDKDFKNCFQDPDEAQFEVDEATVGWKDIKVLESKDSEKPYSCALCDYTARYKASVQRHFQRHHGNKNNKPYKCTHCEFATRTKDSIGLHIKRSKTEFEQNCRCGNFTTYFKCAFLNHQKIHNAFRCTICTYSCRQKYDLEKHYLMHSGAGIKCRFCDFKAIRKDSLLRHEATHTGIKPYKCKFCDYSAVRQSLLETHIKKQHTEVLIKPEVRSAELADDVIVGK